MQLQTISAPLHNEVDTRRPPVLLLATSGICGVQFCGVKPEKPSISDTRDYFHHPPTETLQIKGGTPKERSPFFSALPPYPSPSVLTHSPMRRLPFRQSRDYQAAKLVSAYQGLLSAQSLC